MASRRASAAVWEIHMPKVFLSHSSRDKPVVTRIAQDLQAKGIKVWLDAWEILAGDSFIQRIQEGLHGADFIVLALSPHAVGSGWTEKEWQSRLDREIRTRQVRIIPILLEDCDIPALLSDKHYADFRDDYEIGLATLVKAIEGHSARTSGAPAAPPPTRLTPYEARLVVTRADGKLSARWYAPEESNPFDLRPPLGDDELGELRWYLETYIQFAGAGDRARARNLEASLQEWGRALFDALFNNIGGGAVARDLARAVSGDRPVLLTLATDDPEVLGQPWEMLRNRQGPLTFQGVSFRRQLREAGHIKESPLDLPLRVLLIVSRPTDTGFIDPRSISFAGPATRETRCGPRICWGRRNGTADSSMRRRPGMRAPASWPCG
jgi:hypothetical protein